MKQKKSIAETPVSKVQWKLVLVPESEACNQDKHGPKNTEVMPDSSLEYEDHVHYSDGWRSLWVKYRLLIHYHAWAFVRSMNTQQWGSTVFA